MYVHFKHPASFLARVRPDARSLSHPLESRSEKLESSARLAPSPVCNSSALHAFALRTSTVRVQVLVTRRRDSQLPGSSVDAQMLATLSLYKFAPSKRDELKPGDLKPAAQEFDALAPMPPRWTMVSVPCHHSACLWYLAERVGAQGIGSSHSYCYLCGHRGAERSAPFPSPTSFLPLALFFLTPSRSLSFVLFSSLL
ncbi:hypothetical protein V8C26DRAFT_413045 [Trichoderma gracile]